MGGLSDVDAELFRKLSEFATVANRGDMQRALDAANLVFAHGMFKCGLQRTTDERRDHMLQTCAERFLDVGFDGHQMCAGDLHLTEISKDPRAVMTFVFNCGNYTQKHLRDVATAESKRTLSTRKSFTRVPVPFCNERELRKKLVCALCWHQDLIRAMLQAASQRPAFLPLVRSHVRGVRYGISRQVQHYLERLSDLSSKTVTAATGKSNNLLTSDGLFKWTQTYCEAWMSRFAVVEAEFADMLDPDVSAASAWRTQTTPAEIMRMRALESVEASISKPNIRESSGDAGAVCGMFLSSALKAQEEHYKLHTAVTLMKAKQSEAGEADAAKDGAAVIALSRRVGSLALSQRNDSMALNDEVVEDTEVPQVEGSTNMPEITEESDNTAATEDVDAADQRRLSSRARSKSRHKPPKPHKSARAASRRGSMASMEALKEDEEVTETPKETADESTNEVQDTKHKLLLPGHTAATSTHHKEVSLLDAEVTMPLTQEEDGKVEDTSQIDPFYTQELGTDAFPTVEIGQHVGSQFDSQLGSTSQLSHPSTNHFGSQFSMTGSQFGAVYSSGAIPGSGYPSQALPSAAPSQVHLEAPPGPAGSEWNHGSVSASLQGNRNSLTGAQPVPIPPTMFVQHPNMTSPWQHHPHAHMAQYHRHSLPTSAPGEHIPGWVDPSRSSFGGSSFMSMPTGSEMSSMPSVWYQMPTFQRPPQHTPSPYPYSHSRQWQSGSQSGMLTASGSDMGPGNVVPQLALSTNMLPARDVNGPATARETSTSVRWASLPHAAGATGNPFARAMVDQTNEAPMS